MAVEQGGEKSLDRFDQLFEADEAKLGFQIVEFQQAQVEQAERVSGAILPRLLDGLGKPRTDTRPSLIHIFEPTRLLSISYAVACV